MHVASPEWQKARQDDAIERWTGSYDFEMGMLRFKAAAKAEGCEYPKLKKQHSLLVEPKDK